MRLILVLTLMLAVLLLFSSKSTQTHDVAITEVTPSKTLVAKGQPVFINVTVKNQGDHPENFNVTLYYNGTIPNGDFEKDPAGTSFDDLSDWNHSSWDVYGGNVIENLEVVDNYYFTGNKSLYSYVKTDEKKFHSRVVQYLSTENPINTSCNYISLWIAGDGYTTTVEYHWHIGLHLTDGTNHHYEKLRCDCWGSGGGCTPTHFDHYNATKTGADGRIWKRYTRKIPNIIDKSNLTIMICHYQCSWQWTTASSWYRLDSIYLSDSQGNPLADIQTKTIKNLPPNEETTLTFTWNTTDLSLGNYLISAHAHPVQNETNLMDNTYINGVISITSTCTLTILTTTGGTTNPPPGTYTYPCGFSVKVTAFPDAYHVFDHWEINGFRNYSNPITITMHSNVTLHVIFGIHDIAVKNVTLSKTVVGQGYCLNVTVTIENQGNYTESFNVTVYYNKTIVEVKAVTNLLSSREVALIFVWNTTGVAYGNYMISVMADVVPNEADTIDNVYLDGVVLVTIPGDVNGDRKVNMRDLYSCLILNFGCEMGDPCYVANYDINGDGKIDMKDHFVAALHFGELW